MSSGVFGIDHFREKLTGASKEEYMIALGRPKNLKHVRKAIEQIGGRAFVARKTADEV